MSTKVSQNVFGFSCRISSKDTPSAKVLTLPLNTSHIVTSLPSSVVNLDTYSFLPVTALYPIPPPLTTSIQSTPSASSIAFESAPSRYAMASLTLKSSFNTVSNSDPTELSPSKNSCEKSNCTVTEFSLVDTLPSASKKVLVPILSGSNLPSVIKFSLA